MALAIEFYEATFLLVDKGNNSTTRTYRLRAVDDDGDISALITALQDMATDLAAVSDAAIKKASLTAVYVDGTGFAIPTVGEVENNARITAQIYGDPLDSATIEIPAPKDTIFVGAAGTTNYNVVDFADPALTGFLGNFVGASSAWLVSDGESISLNGAKGKRVHHRSSKG